MSDIDTDRTADYTTEVVDLIERYTDIGIPADSSQHDTFAAVLFEIGDDMMRDLQETGMPHRDSVAALEAIAEAFARVQERSS